MSDGVLLLVEDNPDDVELTLRALRMQNVTNEVVVARDGTEALDYLFATGSYAGRDVSELPVVMMLDLNMPKVGGLEVLRRVRADERIKRLPVVVLTTSSEEQDLAMSYDLGANAYVRKPVEFVQFAEAIKQLGQFWLLLNQPPPTPKGA